MKSRMAMMWLRQQWDSLRLWWREHTGKKRPATFRDEVLTDAPLVYYRLNETGGTVATSETGSNQGTYSDGHTPR